MKKIIVFTLIILLIILFIFKVTTNPSDEELTFIDSKQEITGHVVYEETEEIPEEMSDDTETFEPEITILEDVEIELPEEAPVEVVSDVNCIDNKIELLLANPTNKTLTLVEDIVIHLNGMIVVDPECRISTLMPGKKVFCSDISGHLAIRKEKKNTLQISMGSEKFDFVVDCEN
ncbi:hypothetical protein KY343_03985 [Candidatus Woesearchaeota archaeon]|nr:hypothetical protein [Candidatus Woesearchaeota archaeon]